MDRPIIFSGPMVCALLAGRKTQTRRVIASPHARLRFAPGDKLWVRETVACGACAPGKPSYWSQSFWRREQGTIENKSGLWYRADGLTPATQITDRGRWIPAIHMPRWASRMTLHVTDVKIEKLQNINPDDARAEGLEWVPPTYGVAGIAPSWTSDPVQSFAALWRHINGENSWDQNPWVAAVHFLTENHNAQDQGAAHD